MTDFSRKPGLETEGWESLADDESVGRLAPNEELEQALREAADAVDAREAEARARRSPDPVGDPPEVDVLKAELSELKDRHLRLQADFENYRRRQLKEREEAAQYGHQNLVKDLLYSVDNLERALDHARKSGGEDLDALLQGIELVLRELAAALAKHGVTEIEAAGLPFDPSVHEALAQVPDATVPPNTVVQVFHKGYRLRDRLVRPAQVVVSRAAEMESGGDPVSGATGS